MNEEIKRLQKAIGKKDKHIFNQKGKIIQQEEIIKQMATGLKTAEDTIKKLTAEIKLMQYKVLEIPSPLSDEEIRKIVNNIKGFKPQLMVEVDDVVQSVTKEVTISFDKLVQYEVEMAKSNFFQEIIKEIIRTIAK